MRILKFLTILFFLFNFNFAYSQSENESDKITKNLRCLICQGQSVYDSDSEFANSLKILVKKKLDEGLNEKQIYEFFLPGGICLMKLIVDLFTRARSFLFITSQQWKSIEMQPPVSRNPKKHEKATFLLKKLIFYYKLLTLIRPGGEEIRNIVFDGLSFRAE